MTPLSAVLSVVEEGKNEITSSILTLTRCAVIPSTILGLLQEIPDIITWLSFLLSDTPLPSAAWSISKSTGDITASVQYPEGVSSPAVANVTMWSASSCTKGATGKRRDFRYSSLDDPCECGISTDGDCLNAEAFSWVATELQPNERGEYVAHADIDPSGAWTGFFIDFTFDKPSAFGGKLGTWPVNKPGCLDFTTEVSIWPDTFPFEECFGVDCYGSLL